MDISFKSTVITRYYIFGICIFKKEVMHYENPKQSFKQ